VPIEPGQIRLHYRILDKLGEGGMGEVWKAIDTSLNREVAIKVLPSQLAANPERLARFDREAKLLATLNHPNIAAVYGFHEYEGERFVVMEFVDGEDLAQRLARGPLPVPDAIEIAGEIAEGLAAAHDRGIVHRDLKPANVRVTPEGAVKVLDFGLAKSLSADESASGSDPAATATRTSGGTAHGVILGTVAYMSPEQARGKPVDRRTDLWAFGCVLYEMLTGTRAFGGETVTDTLSAIISQQPEWERLPAGTPEPVRRLLRRCLEKRPTHRLRDAADARLELLEAADPAAMATTAGEARRPNRWSRPLGLLTAALVGAAAVGAAWLVSAPPATGTLDALPPVHQVTFTGDVVEPIARGGSENARHSVGMDLAADGRTAVYLTRDLTRVILIDLDGGGSQTLFTAEPGTQLTDVAWSPDGGRAYVMTWPYAEHVLSVPRLGGEPRRELDLGHLRGLNGLYVRRLRDDRWVLVGAHNTLYIGNNPAALEARGTQLHGDGVFRLEGLETVGQIAVVDDGRLLAFQGLDSTGLERTGFADADGKTEFVDAWSGLAPLGWTDGGGTLWLWRSTGLDLGDLLRVATNPSTGRPTAAPAVVYPRLTARSVQVSADGRRLALRAGDRVVNLHEFTLDRTPPGDDNPRRSRTRGTGRWKVYDTFPDGALLAGLEGDLGWELFSISSDDVQRSLIRLERPASWAVVSADGQAVAMTVMEPGPAILIHDVIANRSRTIPVSEPLSALDWSADRKRIAAMTTSSANHLVLVDVDSGEARTVPLQCGERCEFAWEFIRFGPTWPYAAVTSETDTWIANVETGELRHLAADTYSIAAWRGPHIYFSRGGGQTTWPGPVLFRIPSAGGPEERLFDAPVGCAEELQLGPDARTVVCALDESRLDIRLVDGLGGG